MARPSILRVVVSAIAVLVLLWVLMILAFSTLLASPTSGSGEGRFPGGTVTGAPP